MPRPASWTSHWGTCWLLGVRKGRVGLKLGSTIQVNRPSRPARRKPIPKFEWRRHIWRLALCPRACVRPAGLACRNLQTKKGALAVEARALLRLMAEEERFELSRRTSRPTVFKTAAFNRSATPPWYRRSSMLPDFRAPGRRDWPSGARWPRDWPSGARWPRDRALQRVGRGGRGIGRPGTPAAPRALTRPQPIAEAAARRVPSADSLHYISRAYAIRSFLWRFVTQRCRKYACSPVRPLTLPLEN